MLRPPMSFRGRLLLIAAGALVLRLVYVLVLARKVSMAGDASYFHATANLLAEGKGFIEPFVYVAYDISVPTASHPPLYPIVLAPVSLLGGTGELAHRATGCFIGVACLVVLALIARRIAGDRAGLAAAGIAAVYPILIAADGALMSEALYGLLVATALLMALRLRERRDLASAAGLGAAIGLAALTRSEALALIPLLAWPLALRAGGGGAAPRVARLALVTGACVLVLAPWGIRNASAFGEPFTISHNDSTVLAGANCDATYGGPDIGQWRFDCISQRQTFEEGKQAATWRREGIDYIRDHAGRLPAVVAVRLLRTWDLYQPRRQVQFAESRATWAQQAGTVVYFLLLPLAGYGAVLVGRRSRGQLAILLAPVALVIASSVIAYGVPRFRHAAELVIVVLAGVAVAALADRRRGGGEAARHLRAQQSGLVVYLLLLPLTVAGAVLLRRRGEPLRLLLAPILLVTPAGAIGYGSTRFRVPAEIPLVVLGACALAAVVDRGRRVA
jgi:4-amino-4-deoxy-L-arabinose transferase-like glycosyltransferase